jgi:hypothetical protein
MKKLKLEVEELAVESFATDGGAAMSGTVEAYGTFGGNTCGPENSCGPQTCPPAMCVIDTDYPGCNGGGSVGCGTGTGCTNPSGVMSCVGCTSYDYTNQGGDSCDFCMGIYTASPQYCPCV